MLDRSKRDKMARTVGFLALAGILALSMLVKTCNAVRIPDERYARRIFKWALPDIDVFAAGGEEVKLNDENARFERNTCWTVRGDTISSRRYPEPKYTCVFWLTGSNGTSYAMALLVKYIPESSVYVTPAGRRLDWADVGRYDIDKLTHWHQRKIIKQHAVKFSKPGF